MPAYSRILLPWDSQPQESVGVDWGNPLSRGLVFLVPGHGLYDDIALGKRATITGSIGRVVTKDGLFPSFTGSQYLTYPNFGAELSNTTPATIAWIQTPIGAAAYSSVGQIAPSGAAAGFAIAYQHATASGYRFATGIAGSSAIDWDATGDIGGLTNGQTDRFILRTSTHLYTTTKSDFSLFKNFRKFTGSAASNFAGLTLQNRFGAHNAGSDWWEGALGQIAIWNRALTDEEALSYNANPLQLFAPRTIWVPVSAATGGAYTLTADAGAYALSGQDAAIVKSRIVVADAGAYSLSGQDAALKVGHVLTADAGAYTIAGQDAELLRGRVVTADAGAYALAGQDATLTYTPAAGAYSLTAEPGAYVLAGQDAALIRGRVVSADAGAYALAGQDATLTYALANAYTLTCEAGAYTLTGRDATIAFSGAAAPVIASGGGIYPTPRRKTKQEIDEDRKRLGILPDETEVQTGIVEVLVKRPKITLEQLIGKPAADTHRADMERASAAHKLRKRRQDDDLLMMM